MPTENEKLLARGLSLVGAGRRRIYLRLVSFGECLYDTVRLYPTPSRNSFVFFACSIFFVAHFSGGVFLLCSLSYPAR